MHNYYPILWVGAIIGVISTLLIELFCMEVYERSERWRKRNRL